MKGRLHTCRVRCGASKAGVVLVLVMIILVLVSALVVALLNMAKTERKASTAFLTSAKVQQLADNAVGVVQAQINQATTRGSSMAWASQPGMIRTYDTNGNLSMAYKLYSAETLTEVDAAKLNDDAVPNDWASKPSVWVDLNAPVSASGSNVYPILDPGFLDLPDSERPQGFDIQNAPGVTSNQRAPMPVRWLYVLQNGNIVAPLNSGSTTTIPNVSGTNPITGRIAFWTDDESCKVNLNTAAVGGYWDTPHFYTTEDRKFATSQPLNGEFQRYPGHPAMTSLSAVFPRLDDQKILSTMTPRYQWGGSQQGVTDTYSMTQALNSGTVAGNPLYASVDEMIFLSGSMQREKNPNLTAAEVARANFFLTTDSRAPEVNLFNLPRIACWPIATDTNGRTAFDRLIAFASTVGDYPYYFQRQSAFSPTADASIQRNNEIFGYLQYLTGQTVPGFGVRLSDKFGADNDQILTEIWDYIRCTNLYDSRLPAGKQFTGDTNTPGSGYGYAVPLENGTSRGFGRSMTLSELAFIFICTADPVDTQNTPQHPKGMLDSNDPSTNPTLAGSILTQNQRRVQMMILPSLFSPSLGDISIRPRNFRITISGLGGMTLGGAALFPGNSSTFQPNNGVFNTGYHRRFLGGLFDYRSLLRGISAPAGQLDSTTPNYPFISRYITVSVPNPGMASPGTMSFASGQLTVILEIYDETKSVWTTEQTILVTPPAGYIPIPNLVRQGTAASPNGGSATTAKYWWSFSRTGLQGSGGRLAALETDPGYFNVSNGVAVQAYWNSPAAGTLIREAEDANYYTDVVRSMSPGHGDLRLIAALKNVPDNVFTTIGDWTSTGAANAIMHTLANGTQGANTIPGGSQMRQHYVTRDALGPAGANTGLGGFCCPDFRRDTPVAVRNAVAASGDFDNGTVFWPDGSYINKPDEGNVYSSGGSVPYFDSSEQESIVSNGFFSPNRIMPGPGMFGSLPTHVKRYAANSASPGSYAWRTLLFRKQPNHPDAVAVSAAGIPAAAPDHLLMDLFWMPVVEPFAISDSFSTAGKVNMNYQLQPFPYITRATGLYAVLQREKITSVANSLAGSYKFSADPAHPQIGAASLSTLRFDIDIPATLQQFTDRFANSSGRIFLSPTELCDLWLVPQGESLSSMDSYWASHNLTGDNMRERPYTTIIPRLTTKSNTFTVHYRVQILKSPNTVPVGTWDESKGIIAGEYRGSTTIQRFVDLNNQTLLNTNFATAHDVTLDDFYRWRVINVKQFAP